MLNPESLITRLIAAQIARPDQIEGCSESDLLQIESTIGIQLPREYRKFLLTLGRGAGRFMIDCEFTVDELLAINREAKECVYEFEGDTLEIPANAFVFSMRQGEQFVFFMCGQHDNPAVYFYIMRQHEFMSVAETFWDFIEEELSQQEEVYRRFPGGPFGFSR